MFITLQTDFNGCSLFVVRIEDISDIDIAIMPNGEYGVRLKRYNEDWRCLTLKSSREKAELYLRELMYKIELAART